MQGLAHQERLLIAAVGLARTQAPADTTTEYVKQRHVFLRQLIELQNKRCALAECHTLARICPVILDDCAQQQPLHGELDAVTASMAKYWITGRQTEVADRCLQLHGGLWPHAQPPDRTHVRERPYSAHTAAPTRS
ncbi:acyl-CoA dehydrogenase family protein [Streptomyces mirabilis]|jgi:acyl-CoA dehydrogenase|uniref:Acyl-CoA dehydrogenase, C-terminal domain n=1 Tax=Streptomyces mirabilis TaxID=68239 RepID=A0A1I2XJY3_9ACTN|nr:Acyl-CoA dehydrogenase, C-terminal domain [Streptomyces mirabilis]